MLNHPIVSITKKGEHVFTLVCLYVCCALVACAVAGARKGSERGFAPPWRFSLARRKEGGCCITKTLNAIIALCSSVSRMRAPKTKIADRASAQVTSGATHFSLMLGREMRTQLPELSRETVDLNRQGVHERGWSSKLKGKAYAEEMRGAVSMKSIELGDEVLLRAEKSNKLLSNFCPRLFEVIRKTGVRLLSETTQDRRSPTSSPGHFSRWTRLEDHKQCNFREEVPCPEESHCKRQ